MFILQENNFFDPIHDVIGGQGKKGISRANYQAYIWRSCFEQFPQIPEPEHYGWFYKNETLSIDWMDGKPAPGAVLDLLSCKCKRKCVPNDCICVPNNCICVPNDCICVPNDCICVPNDCICVPNDCICVPNDCICVPNDCICVPNDCICVPNDCICICICIANGMKSTDMCKLPRTELTKMKMQRKRKVRRVTQILMKMKIYNNYIEYGF